MAIAEINNKPVRKMIQAMQLKNSLENILIHVDKPARYIGGEFNTTLKAPEEVDVRLALAFPDVYDIGMSYHGFKIFYERVNAMDNVQCERTFAPWPDFETKLREQNIPLYLLESKLPVKSADIVGFTLQHEMNYTNLLNMLDLSQIPLLSEDRSEIDPIVIAGGHGAFNPEVLADYIDVFVVGDGEWALIQIIETIKAAKKLKTSGFLSSVPEGNYRYRGDGTVAKRKAVPTFGIDDMQTPGPWRIFDEAEAENLNRENLLLKLSLIPGVYVPRFYQPEYHEDGTLKGMIRTTDRVPEVITKSNFDVRDDFGCTKPVVPLMRVVHDRFAIEIKRGCMVGCRFCQAGMITRPLRERNPRQIVDIAREGIKNTGYDEISLLSLSSADYSGILELTRALRNELAEENISISLPSLRINAFDVDLADEIGSVRKSGFTFAPEAGTARLRQVINKAVDEQRFHETIEAVLKKGWRTLKFYFMCGLPTETDEDLQGIVDLTNKAIEYGKKHCGNNFQLNISLSPFIPKPQTPFQWHAQPSIEEFEQKYNYVQSRINRRYVSLKKHSLYESVIEGVLGRGDRRVGKAIRRAWELGCKFDNWHEYMRYDLWNQAFDETGIAPAFYANRLRGKDEVFAWDHIEASLGKKFLWKEKTKSELVKITTDCSTTVCATCKVCDFKEVKNLLSMKEDGEYYAPPAKGIVETSNDQVQKVRFTFSKTSFLRFTSHLDMVKVMQLIFRRCGLKVAYSQGFNPSPKMTFAPPLPMGFAAENDLLEVVFTENYDVNLLLESLKSIPLDGLIWKDAEEVPLRGAPFSSILNSADYKIEFPTSVNIATIKDAVLKFQESDVFNVEIEGKNKKSVKNLKESFVRFHWEDDDFYVRVSLKEGAYINPVTALSKISGVTLPLETKATRLQFQLQDENLAVAT